MNPACKEPVYIIIPVHNRKNITLKCLETLSQHGDLQRYHLVVVDDGSTDGTTEAIHSLYRDVTVLAGDGNLWWTGAIKKGMEYAYERGAEYFIWLNDDCYPQKGAITKLLDACKSNPKLIVGGQSLDPDTLEPSYGGIVGKKNRIELVNAPHNSWLECDGLAGNFVCLPRSAVELTGYPDNKLFPQYYGDVAYTNVAKKKSFNLLIYGEAIAFCKDEHPSISWLTPDRHLLEYWREYFQVKSPYYWKASINYYREIFGLLGILIYIYEHVIKFWLIFVLVYPLPLSFRTNLKQAYRNNLSQ